ncbi:DnaB-like helicase C-terminal domain-containing protein [Roseibium alexandrii]|uniref:DnaB-like helicase C-terminal domain-containing protein n=1 Tax=Roseibium alexandrii TaxID=388408 RepID=UPI003752FD15
MIDGFPDIECEFLGLMLQDKTSINAYRTRVPEEAFTNHVTRTIWQGMCALGASGTDLSVPALRETVTLNVEQARIPSVPSFLMACMQQAKGDLGLDELAEILCERALKTQISTFAGDLMKKITDGRAGAEEIALDGSAFLANLAAARRPVVGQSIHDAGKEAIRQMEEAQRTGQTRGHDWGIRSLDDLMGRIVMGDFGLLIGPSGHGKSAFARGLANHIAKREPVLTISAEEAPADISMKDLSARSGVSSQAIEANTINEAEFEALVVANQQQHGLQSFFEYTDDMRISNIEALIRAFKHRHGACGAVFVDTIDDIDPEEPRLGMTERVIMSCRKLDKLATKLRVPIIGLGQVKTIYNDRTDITLRLSDSYGGQAVRNKASWVVLMHRPQKKLGDVLIPGASTEVERLKWKGEYDTWKDKAEFICAKRRRGPDGRNTKTGWSGPATAFFDLDDGGPMEDMF